MADERGQDVLRYLLFKCCLYPQWIRAAVVPQHDLSVRALIHKNVVLVAILEMCIEFTG